MRVCVYVRPSIGLQSAPPTGNSHSDHISHRRACLLPSAARAGASPVQDRRSGLYKVLHGLTPAYFGPLNYVADLLSRRFLRSATTNRLAVPPVKLTTVANRAFPVVDPRTWNDLPENMISAESLFISPASQDLSLHRILF